MTEQNNTNYVPIRYTDVTVWDEIREQAAHLIALNEHTDRQICESLSMEITDLVRLRSQVKFMERVAEISEDINWTLLKQGIANKQNRVNSLNDRWKGLKQVMFERSQEPMFRDIPGGKTGMLTVTYKAGGRAGWQEEFQVDVAMLSEMRQIEMQAAKELGQWVDKQQIDMNSRAVTVSVIAEIDKYERAFLKALEMSAPGEPPPG